MDRNCRRSRNVATSNSSSRSSAPQLTDDVTVIVFPLSTAAASNERLPWEVMVLCNARAQQLAAVGQLPHLDMVVTAAVSSRAKLVELLQPRRSE